VIQKSLLDVAVQGAIVALLLGLANWFYRSVLKRKNDYGPHRAFRRMSTDEMMEGLRRVLDDPKTSPALREKATQQLGTASL
jgi:hypothetical protein